jgi:hypothetical protein
LLANVYYVNDNKLNAIEKEYVQQYKNDKKALANTNYMEMEPNRMIKYEMKAPKICDNIKAKYSIDMNNGYSRLR